MSRTKKIKNAATLTASVMAFASMTILSASAEVLSYGDANTVSTSIPVGNTGFGALTIDGGSSLIKDGVTVGSEPSGNGLVSVLGGNLTANTWLNLGQQGTGTLIVEGAGLVKGIVTATPGILIGHRAGSIGTATVKGGGELHTIGQLAVGVAQVDGSGGIPGAPSFGSLNIILGGLATAQSVSIGGQPNAVGAVLVDGAGSDLTINGVSNSSGIIVGQLGEGSLTVQNDGAVSSPRQILVGFDNYSTGSITVQSGGSVTTPEILFVGRRTGARGAVTVKTGGMVTAGKLILVGQEPGSSGAIEVDGAGSTLRLLGLSDSSNVGALFAVGRGGTGALNITNGGSVLIDPEDVDPTRYSVFAVGSVPGNVTFVGGARNGSVLVDGIGSNLVIDNSKQHFGMGFDPESSNTLQVTNGGSVILTNIDGLSAGTIGFREGSNNTVVVDGAPEVEGTPVPSTLDTGRLLGCAKQFDRSVVVPLTEANLTEPAGIATLAVRNGGIVGADIVVIGSGCTLLGNGTVDANNLINEGTILPGNSPGTLTVTNDLRHDGSLVMEVIGTAPGQYDVLKVGGTVTFQPGSLINVVTRGTCPSQGTVAIVEAAAIEGSVFVSVDGSAVKEVDASVGSGIAVIIGDDCSVSVVAIGSAALVNLLNALVADVIDVNLKVGIEGALDAKLDAALDALSDLIANNDGAALGALDAFINAVDAQTDISISVEDAEGLVAGAQAIIDQIGLI